MGVELRGGWFEPDRPHGVGVDAPMGYLGMKHFAPGPAKEPASRWALDPDFSSSELEKTRISLLKDAGVAAVEATPTYAWPPAALPTDTGSSSWMLPRSNDVSTLSDVFGRFDPRADALRNAPAGPPVSFGPARAQLNAGST
eukprot:438969-Pyramimonas_sp.AAC.1